MPGVLRSAANKLKKGISNKLRLNTPACRDECCNHPPCNYWRKATACSNDNSCGVRPIIYIHCISICDATNEIIAPGQIITYGGHCWVVDADDLHYRQCPLPPGQTLQANERCLPVGAILIDTIFVFNCIADCGDPRCASFFGWLECTRCPGTTGNFPTVVMRCDLYYQALNLACACPVGCASIDNRDGTYSIGCFHVSSGAILFPDIPDGAIEVQPSSCSCCECRGGSGLGILAEGQPACGPFGAPIRECDGRSGLERFNCVNGVGGYDQHTIRISCCCNNANATGTFSGEFISYDHPPGVTCDCGGICERARVTNGRWDSTSWSCDYIDERCFGGGQLTVVDSGPRSEPTYGNGCGDWGRAVLIQLLGRADACETGINATGRSDCNTFIWDQVIQNEGSGRAEHHFRSTLNPSPGNCASGCGSRPGITRLPPGFRGGPPPLRGFGPGNLL
jgi:hypothetical protein